MASTVAADKEDEEYREYLDEPDVLKQKVQQLAGLIRKHRGKVVFFTGAGISTGAGIPDFRSGLNSVTGMPAGKWCKDATKTQWSSKEKEEEKKRTNKTKSTLQAIPTASHMALVALQQAGIARGLISQNCDGLHRRSGFDPEKLAELHGNTNLEYCAWCGKEYFRDYSASRGRHTKGKLLKQELWGEHSKLDLINPRKGNHYTGRRCLQNGCQGYLFDSTIDFGDNLPELHINRGYDLANNAELMIVLGSRCSVSPACDMPISVGISGRPLVVVNLQSTGADPHAQLRIGAKIDDVMVPVMELLGIRIPKFTLKRRVCISRTPKTESGASSIKVRGVEIDGTPVDSLWNAQALFIEANEGRDEEFITLLKGEKRSLLNTAPVRLNQDFPASSKYAKFLPRPGDKGNIEIWPWMNEEKPGWASVGLTSGDLKGRVYSMSADLCDVVDGMVSLNSGGKVENTSVNDLKGCVINAGSCHGPLLSHIIEMPPKHLNAHCSMLRIMFRSHYLEPSLEIPFPEEDNSTSFYDLEYEPVGRTWAMPREVALETAEKKTSKVSETRSKSKYFWSRGSKT